MISPQARKLRSPSSRRLMIGLGCRSSQTTNGDQADDHRDEERLDPPERVAEPVPLLALGVEHLERSEPERDQAQADVVDLQARVASSPGPPRPSRAGPGR